MIRKINDIDIKLLGSGNDSATTTSNVSPVLLKSVLVPANTIKIYDNIRVRSLFRKETVNSTTYNIYLYWNTSAALNGSETQVAIYNVLGTEPSPNLYRTINVGASDTFYVMNTSFSSLSDIGDFNTTISSLTVDYSIDGYFIAAALRTSGTRTNDNILCSYLTVEL